MSDFLIRQAPEELPLVQNFQAHAQLGAVRMKSFSARSADAQPVIQGGLQLGWKHSVVRAQADGVAAQFDVKLELEALGDNDPAKMLFQIDCCFELTYTLAPAYTPTAAELEAFKQGNAVFHCWPYLREFVQSATQRLGLAVPPLPLLRMQLGPDPNALPSPPKPGRKPVRRRKPTPKP